MCTGGTRGLCLFLFALGPWFIIFTKMTHNFFMFWPDLARKSIGHEKKRVIPQLSRGICWRFSAQSRLVFFCYCYCLAAFCHPRLLYNIPLYTRPSPFMSFVECRGRFFSPVHHLFSCPFSRYYKSFSFPHWCRVSQSINQTICAKNWDRGGNFRGAHSLKICHLRQGSCKKISRQVSLSAIVILAWRRATRYITLDLIPCLRVDTCLPNKPEYIA